MPSTLPNIQNVRFGEFGKYILSFDAVPGVKFYQTGVTIISPVGQQIFPVQIAKINTVGAKVHINLASLEGRTALFEDNTYHWHIVAIGKPGQVTEFKSNETSVAFVLDVAQADEINGIIKAKDEEEAARIAKEADEKKRKADRRNLLKKIVIGSSIIIVLLVATLYGVLHRKHKSVEDRVEAALKTNAIAGGLTGTNGTNTAAAPTNTIPALPKLGMALGGAASTNLPVITGPAATNDDIKINESKRETVIAMDAANALRQERAALQEKINQLKIAAEVREIQMLTSNASLASGYHNSPHIVGNSNVINNTTQIINIGNSNSNIIVNPISQKSECKHEEPRHDKVEASFCILQLPTIDMLQRRTTCAVPTIQMLPKFDARWDLRGRHWTPGPENGTITDRIAGGQDGWIADDHLPVPKQYYGQYE